MEEQHATLRVLPGRPRLRQLADADDLSGAREPRPVRVHVVGTDPLARVGLRTLLADHPAIHITGESAPGPQLARALRTSRPRVLVVHGALPAEERLPLMGDQDGPDGLRMLTVGETPGDIPAHGHLPGTATAGELTSAVVLAAAGYTLVGAGRRALPPPGPRLSSVSPDELTEREGQVLDLLARGLSNAEIAHALTLSEHTVKTHVQNMLHKLRLRNRVHAAIYAFETGLRGTTD
ncbi:response regulator transcription factor [Streptomyces sp. ITFR-16]|uniref:response regulator transcription factor n=1 Tax=Streptomyces sp. ITFR-16 TaxID=3075198 RepID=UPI002888FFC7|nr:response regulator transcription factor [Streptomyces sp. ITFR-16]WNI27202.1 response regulator transcription factor [Streptomyces sp. ITFR-16]